MEERRERELYKTTKDSSVAQDAWAVFVLRPFSSLFQSILHLKQIKSLGNKRARRYEVGGKHRGRVSGISEQDESERSLSRDSASRSNRDCSNIKALVMKRMNACTKEPALGLLYRRTAHLRCFVFQINRYKPYAVDCTSCFVP